MKIKLIVFNKSKIAKLGLIVVLISLIIITAIIILLFNNSKVKETYNLAIQSIENKDYNQANKYLKQVLNYKDSKELYNKIRLEAEYEQNIIDNANNLYSAGAYINNTDFVVAFIDNQDKKIIKYQNQKESIVIDISNVEGLGFINKVVPTADNGFLLQYKSKVSKLSNNNELLWEEYVSGIKSIEQVNDLIICFADKYIKILNQDGKVIAKKDIQYTVGTITNDKNHIVILNYEKWTKLNFNLDIVQENKIEKDIVDIYNVQFIKSNSNNQIVLAQTDYKNNGDSFYVFNDKNFKLVLNKKITKNDLKVCNSKDLEYDIPSIEEYIGVIENEYHCFSLRLIEDHTHMIIIAVNQLGNVTVLSDIPYIDGVVPYVYGKTNNIIYNIYSTGPYGDKKISLEELKVNIDYIESKQQYAIKCNDFPKKQNNDSTYSAYHESKQHPNTEVPYYEYNSRTGKTDEYYYLNGLKYQKTSPSPNSTWRK